MADLQRDNPLFDRHLPMQIQDGLQDTRNATLVFRILQGTQPTTTVGQTEKVIHLEITDERDPYFLYYMDVGEAEFHHLKRDQSILVEFNVFALKLIELIELCLYGPSQRSSAAAGTASTANSSAPPATIDPDEDIIPAPLTTLPPAIAMDHAASKYSAKLDTTTNVFSIVESNKFKQLTHISLNLKLGDDHAIKLYLASRLSQTIGVAQRQAVSLDGLRTDLQKEQTTNAEMLTELTHLRQKAGLDVQSIRTKHTQELSEAQIQAMETIEGMRVKFESQLDTVRSQLDKTQTESQEKALQYEQQVADLGFAKGQLEFKLRDVERILSSTESDRERLLKEWESVNEHRRDIEKERTDMQREIVKLESKVDSLTQQVKSRDESIEKTLALNRAGEDARNSIEERLNMYIANAEVLQENLRAGAAEIERGNSIINKLQHEAKGMREKIRSKSEVIRRQENVVNELRLKLVDTEHTLSASKEAERISQLKIDSLQQQLNETLDRLQESSNVIAGNQEVITYLNEEVNKWQLGVRVGGGEGGGELGTIGATGAAAAVTPLYGGYGTATGGAGKRDGAMTGAATATAGVTPDSAASTTYGSYSSHYFTMDNKANSTTPAATATATATGTGMGTITKNFEYDVYRKGMQNLGLDDKGLDDWVKTLHSGEVAGVGAVGSGSSGGGGASSGADGVDLESMAYYSLSTATTTEAAAATSKRQHTTSTASPPHKSTRSATINTTTTTTAGTSGVKHAYAWQSPDFGLVDST